MKQKLKNLGFAILQCSLSSLALFVLATIIFTLQQAILITIIYYGFNVLLTLHIDEINKLKSELEQTKTDYVWLKDQVEKLSK